MVVSEGDNLGRADLQWQVEAFNPEDAATAVFASFDAAREIDPHSPHELRPEDDDPSDPEYPVNGQCTAWLTVYDLDNETRWSDQYIRYESGRVEYFGSQN